ncbi:MAG: SGNH/GDSL hydrolase family protein [Gorillibacterium sp.]|nr:SGNH/GDSL hydrolase family protein [Gorillibacterium sp.]
MIKLEPNAIVLFQGDSVTDCGRERGNNENLGVGYANFIAAEIGCTYPDRGITFLNRGIGGNRVVDLQERWEEDCLRLSPTWVSILIGINETWRKYDDNDPTSTEQYYEGYRKLLQRTKDHTDANFILLEPFVLPTSQDRLMWREDLDPKIQAVRALAREFQALYVPLDGMFATASTKVDPLYWAEDGVHPTRSGQALIAKAWLEAVQA